MKDISTNEHRYVLELLTHGIRINGRKLREMRTPVITLSDREWGFATVKFGDTLVAVRVSCKVEKPYEDRPFEGIFTINAEISPMASPSFENGKSTDSEVLLARLIEKAIRRSNALDVESLCIVAGEKVWHITADLHVLNYDGGLLDAGCAGVMAALLHFKKPDVSISGSDITIHDPNERQPVALSVLHVPVCVTYSFFNPASKEENIKGNLNLEIAIADANMQEEMISEGQLYITLNKNRELIQISKSGGVPIDTATLIDLAHDSYEWVAQTTDMIHRVVKESEQARFNAEDMALLAVGAAR